LLLERLQAWKHACGYLEAYVAATEKAQKAHSKEYEKVLKVIEDYLSSRTLLADLGFNFRASRIP
jgi:hypothetical protein